MKNLIRSFFKPVISGWTAVTQWAGRQWQNIKAKFQRSQFKKEVGTTPLFSNLTNSRVHSYQTVQKETIAAPSVILQPQTSLPTVQKQFIIYEASAVSADIECIRKDIEARQQKIEADQQKIEARQQKIEADQQKIEAQRARAAVLLEKFEKRDKELDIIEERIRELEEYNVGLKQQNQLLESTIACTKESISTLKKGIAVENETIELSNKTIEIQNQLLEVSRHHSKLLDKEIDNNKVFLKIDEIHKKYGEEFLYNLWEQAKEKDAQTAGLEPSVTTSNSARSGKWTPRFQYNISVGTGATPAQVSSPTTLQPADPSLPKGAPSMNS